MKVILGDITYPKAEALIIPNDSFGSMKSRRAEKISKAALGGVLKEAKEVVSRTRVEAGQCFTTYPGRLNRRGVKKIYHAVIKRLQSDFTSVYIVQKALEVAFNKVIEDTMATVALCGLGMDPGDLDPISVAHITAEVCKRFDSRVEIKIIDDNREFINELRKRIEGTVYECSK